MIRVSFKKYWCFRWGNTPLDDADKFGHVNVVEYIEAHMRRQIGNMRRASDVLSMLNVQVIRSLLRLLLSCTFSFSFSFLFSLPVGKFSHQLPHVMVIHLQIWA